MGECEIPPPVGCGLPNRNSAMEQAR